MIFLVVVRDFEVFVCSIFFIGVSLLRIFRIKILFRESGEGRILN